jgi:hypothetical protein
MTIRLSSNSFLQPSLPKPHVRKQPSHPPVHVVALEALRRISLRYMVWRRRFLVRGQMTTLTSRGQSLPIELPHRPGLVARIAVHSGVRANQWKAVLMFIDGMDGNLPAIHPVAKFTLRPVFPPVKIGMAILAIAAHIGEHRIDVAFLARHLGVHAAQGIASLAVIKFGLAADRPPCRSGVALLAGNLQLPVRTANRRRRSGLGQQRRSRRHLEEQERVR